MMSKSPIKKSSLFAALLLAVVVLFAGACQTREKGRKPSPDWSRSIPVGVLVRGDIDMLAGQREEEQLVHLVWLQEEDDQQIIHYLQLDAKANPQVDRNLQLPGDQVSRPQIAETAGPKLHILWASRQSGQRGWALQYGQINPTGDLIGETIELVPADRDINKFTIAPDGQGGLYVAWESDADGAIHGAQISSAGEVIQEPVLLVRQGESPFLAGDGSDMYLAWFDDGNMRFAQWPDGRLAETEGEAVAKISLGTGQTLDGPVLGLSGEWAYVLWSTYNSSGLEAGTAATRYVAFPQDAPALSSEQTVRASSAEETPYASYESAYQISQLAPPASIRESAGLIRQPRPTTAQGNELAVAVTLNQESRLDELIQVGLLLFKDGAYAGYQMAGKTDSFSQEPVLAGDASGNLYMAWREGGRGSVAYYALTTAEGRSALDRLSGGDVVSTALSGGMEVVAGILFFPLACIWIVPGLALIGLLHLWRGDSEMRQPLTIAVLLLSVIVSQVVKLAFLPTISFYVPFSAWLDISPRWEDPLRLLVPFITMGIGLLAAILMRRRNDSALAFFFVFITVDAVLTLAVYGVNFLGVF